MLYKLRGFPDSAKQPCQKQHVLNPEHSMSY